MITRSFVHATTSDGVRLSIERFAPAGRSRGAILMQHGLASNGLCFTLPGRSLAEHLAGLGFDCYVPDLRGAGESETPSIAWTVGEYLERDLPAVIDAVLLTSGQATLSWIGHSMGGFLALMYSIEHPDAPIARVITVASTLDYRAGYSVHREFARALPVARFLSTIPYRWFSRMNALVAGSGPLFMPEQINFWRPNVERAVIRRMLSRGFTPIPVPLLVSLKSSFSEDGFSRETATGERFVYMQRVNELRMPTLLLSGSRDQHCSTRAVQTTFDALTNVRDKLILFFGREFGHAEDYGHFDLIVGQRAEQEVWPHIVAFLQATDASAVSAKPSSECAQWSS
jgi:pimeloyl-ACP methyl ester carboxylesterase